jgi:hypothetical protein
MVSGKWAAKSAKRLNRGRWAKTEVIKGGHIFFKKQTFSF